MMKKILLTLLVALLGWNGAMAIPAKPGFTPFKQSDGTVINIQTVGDEFYSCFTTRDGLTVDRNEKGDWYYTTTAGLTAMMAHDPIERSQREIAFVAAERASIVPDPEVAATTRQLIKRVAGMKKVAQVPASGTVRIPVLLVNYTDVKMKHTKSEFDIHYSTAAKSVKQYFKDQSNGKFIPQIELFGVYDLPNTRSYYGEHSGTSNDARLGQMVGDAVTAAANSGDINWANYDNDRDGYCDIVIVVYAGVGEAQASTTHPESIWPCQWDLYSAHYYGDGPGILTYNNTSIRKFAVFNEIKGSSDDGTSLDGIGTFCHEFSHCLGLADYYDTAYGGHFGMGSWSLMGSGSYLDNGDTPCGYSAYDKNFLGWLNLTTPTEDTKYTLNPLNPVGGGCGEAIKITNPNFSNEYLILENRQRAGWDQFLASNGLLIFHVNYDATVFASNKLNNYDIQRMTVEPADNDPTRGTESGDTWGHTQRNFTDTSTPAAKWWTTANGELTGDAGSIGKPITEINQNEDGTVSFWYVNSVEPVAPTIIAPAAQNSRFTAKWQSTGTAPASYTLQAQRLMPNKQIENWSFASFGSVVNGNYLQECSANSANYLPTGWSASSSFYISGGRALLLGSIITTCAYDLRGYEKVTLTISGRIYSSAYSPCSVTISTGKESKTVQFSSSSDASATVTLEVNGDENERILISGSNWPMIRTITLYAGDSATANAPMMAPSETGDSNVRVVTGITANEYLLRDLMPGATYLYKVKSIYANGSESDWSPVSRVVLNGVDVNDTLIGDVNGDGIIDVTDVSALVSYVLGNSSSIVIANADINGDGTYDVSDVTALVSIVLGD